MSEEQLANDVRGAIESMLVQRFAGDGLTLRAGNEITLIVSGKQATITVVAGEPPRDRSAMSKSIAAQIEAGGTEFGR